VENAVSNIFPIVAHGLVAVGTCLFQGGYLVTGLHATIHSNIELHHSDEATHFKLSSNKVQGKQGYISTNFMVCSAFSAFRD
jgi:hypothetical protein